MEEVVGARTRDCCRTDEGRMKRLGADSKLVDCWRQGDKIQEIVFLQGHVHNLLTKFDKFTLVTAQDLVYHTHSNYQ